MNNLFFILGADDPEMRAIEQLLRDCCLGTSYCYASADNVSRCIASNAYSSPIPLFAMRIAGEVPGTIIRFIECCDAPPGASYPRIDHHRPGDPGYGLPPSDFLRASSIGQVISLLATHGHWIGDPLSTATQPAGTLDYDGGWAVSATGALYIDGMSIPLGGPTWAHIPEKYIFVAAADHCLAAAYRGECPGVDPEALMQWRIETRAAHQGIDASDLLKQVHATMADLSHLSHGDPIIDVTGEPGGTLPELPEAAVRLGVAYIASVTDRDGRTKHVLGGHTTSKQVSEWMASQRDLGREVYGDPARGFAGAYV